METLPLRTGITYIDNNGRDITLVVKDEDKNGRYLYSKEVDLWFDIRTGKAPGTDVRITTHRVSNDIAALRAEREDVMQRLKELGLC